jgi:hypothetical protein
MIGMAKTDSFFLRARVSSTGGAFEQIEIDLGSYVDALGKSVLRIHNIAVQTLNNGTMGQDWSIPAGTQSNLSWQLTTQTQSALVDATDKSVIATGRLDIANNGAGTGYTFLSQDSDIMPQTWTQGYLVAVEQLYLAADTDPQIAQADVVIVMECTVETLSEKAAMALALSQS